MPLELPTFPVAVTGQEAVARDDGWLRAARQARRLSYFSLAWMLAEGTVGLIAGAGAHSISVTAWAAGSVVEAAAAGIVIVLLTGRNRFSGTVERRAQKGVAASFVLLIAYIIYATVIKLISGHQTDRTWLAVALLGSSIVLMPVLGRAKHRLGERLGSKATAGEGTQNLLCASQGVIALTGLLFAGAGAGLVDPTAAVMIAAIAAWEAIALWRGDACGCDALPRYSGVSAVTCPTAATSAAEAGPRPPDSRQRETAPRSSRVSIPRT